MLEWEIKTEYQPHDGSASPTQIVADLAQALHTLSLTETMRRQISGSVVEALKRRAGRRAVVIRLLTARVTTPAAAQGCGFFVVEKQERAEGDAEGKLVIELYLFA